MPKIRAYSKSPQSYQALLNKFKSRNLAVSDEYLAVSHLKHIGYYRLVGYGLPLEIKGSENQRTRRFPDGLSFETLVLIYNVDRDIRTLLLGAIERIEVSIRNTINHELACKYHSAHWYMDAGLFSENKDFSHSDFLRQIKSHTAHSATSGSEREKKREVFIQHYFNQYDTPEYPPCWMVAEILPLGAWSIVFQHLKHSKDRKIISREFDLSPITLQSWLHALTYLRNLCAHHARLFGRKLVITPNKDKQLPLLGENYLYNFVCVIHQLLNVISTDANWIDDLNDIFEQLPANYLEHYGFSESWLENPFWLHERKESLL